MISHQTGLASPNPEVEAKSMSTSNARVQGRIVRRCSEIYQSVVYDLSNHNIEHSLCLVSHEMATYN